MRDTMLMRVCTFGLVLTVTACSGNGGGSGSAGAASPTAPTPVAAAPVSYTAVGASDAVGVGASVPCVPLVPCPTGTGYVPVLARRLGQSGATVTLTNLGIPGAVVNAEMLALSASVGGGAPADMVRTSLPLVPASSTLVTVFAGGNDANAIAAAVQAGLAGVNADTYVDSQVAVFGAGFQTLIDGIRSRAPGARLLVVNLPNLAGLPYAAAYPSLRQRSLQRAAVGMTTQVINRMATQGIPVVDLMCDPRVYERGNLSADGFHPSDAGYALLAETLFQASLTGVSTPASSCSQMQVVPGL